MQPSNFIPDFSDTTNAYASISDRALKKRYRWFKRMSNPFFLKSGDVFSKISHYLPEWIYKWAVKGTIYSYFCGGENLVECQKVMNELITNRVGSILDYSVESATSEIKINKAVSEIKKIIFLAKDNPQKIPFTVFKISGLIEITALEAIDSKIKNGGILSKDEEFLLLKNADELCSLAHSNKVRIMIDAEESWIQSAIDYTALRMMEKYNKNQITVFNTYQMYCIDGVSKLQNHLAQGRSNKFYLGCKIVRGAYMEKERVRAIQYQRKSPIHATKELTDEEYDNALSICIKNIDVISLIIGTHNKNSILHLIQLMKGNGIISGAENIYFSQLLGMGDILSFNLAMAGYNVSKYVPYGPVKEVIPYLTRRARENSSVKGLTSQEVKDLETEINRRKTIVR